MTAVTGPAPTVVELKRQDHELHIEWDDDHRSVYRLRYLRGFCPCAACQGHGIGSWTFIPVDEPLVTKIAEMGNYALEIAFSDGHSTGIYSFEILRELCPCEGCRQKLGTEHPVAALPAGETY